MSTHNNTPNGGPSNAIPTAGPGDVAASPFVHPAFFYRSDKEYLGTLVPFITDGLHRQEPVAVAIPTPRLRVLTQALGSVADAMTLIDMADAGRNPGRIIPGVLLQFANAHPDRHVRIIGEPIWPDRSGVEYPACAQHEALINTAFAGRDVMIVCPYDSGKLSTDALEDAHATHPVIWRADDRYHSDRYAPQELISRYNQPLHHPAEAAAYTVTSADAIPDARLMATEQARRLGLSADRFSDLELITTELVTNSLRHTGRTSQLRIWRQDGHLVCEVRDSGYLSDPLVGRRPADPRRPSGRGLLLVHQLADLVRTHTTTAGTTHHVLLRLSRQPQQP